MTHTHYQLAVCDIATTGVKGWMSPDLLQAGQVNVT